MTFSWEVEKALYHAQKHAVSSLPAAELTEWVTKQPRISLTLQKRLLKHPRRAVREALAGHAKTDPVVLDALFESGARRVIEALARNPELPTKIGQRVLTQGHSLARSLSAAHNPLNETMTAKLLSDCEGQFICARVWRREDIRPETLEQVINTPCHPAAFRAAARNPRLKPETRAKLVNSLDLRDWKAVVGNISLTQQEQMTLVTREERGLRAHFCLHPALTEEARNFIVENYADFLVNDLVSLYKLTPHQEGVVVTRALELTCSSIAAQLDDDKLLEKLHDGTCGVGAQERSAANPRLTPQQQLQSFRRGGNHQLFLASNTSITRSLQRKLMWEGSEVSRARLAGNPSLENFTESDPVSFLLFLSPDQAKPFISQLDPDIWEALGRSWSGSFGDLLFFQKEFGK